jgi:hypothetical protein
MFAGRAVSKRRILGSTSSLDEARERAIVLTALERDGYVVSESFSPNVTTIEIAESIGTPINVARLLPSSGIPTVQSLRPRDINQVSENQYSGHYGLGTFPVHSDLAHWPVPPRYFLLRCVTGSLDVFTDIVPWTGVIDVLGTAVLRKAVFATRSRRIGSSTLVRALSDHQRNQILRWDSVFLRPLNEHARELASFMLQSTWTRTGNKVLLRGRGDMVVIDNWRVLHGRSEVRAQSASRHIERVYLSEIFR